MTGRLCIFLAMLSLLAGLPAPASSQTLAAPGGPVVLEVSGRVSRTTDGKVARLDREALQKLPRTVIETSTPWTTGRQRFAGVSLKDLIDAVGAQGSEVSAVAINEYRVAMPLQEAIRDGALVAYEANGEPLPVRNRGPLWIVFAYDESPRLRGEQVLSRSIWQLKLLEVR
jgi:hypothetical protein